MRGFWDLRTEAVNGDRTVGRIPWSKARDYGAAVLGLDGGGLQVFWRAIFHLDEVYHRWMKNEHKQWSGKGGTPDPVREQALASRSPRGKKPQ